MINHPIFIGIALIVGSLLTGRVCLLCGGEAILWVFLIAIGMFIGGVLVLKAYWKNNVSTFNSQHNVNWGGRYNGRF
jgi:hypothetical protein